MSIINQGGTMRYEVTARLTVDADSSDEALRLFDSEYRDTYNVVHLRAEVTEDWMENDPLARRASEREFTHGQRRNGTTMVKGAAPPAASPEPTEWQLEQLTCLHCDTMMTRLALYGHECPELKASREHGARLLEALSTLDPDEGKF